MSRGGDIEAKKPPLDEEAPKPIVSQVEHLDAVHGEHNVTFFKALKLYPKAIAWSAYVSIGVIMLAFDPQLLGNLFAMPQFARQFGHKYKGEVGSSPNGERWISSLK